MLDLTLGFFDTLFTKLFLDAVASKITDAIDRRNVRRQVERAADVPGQTLFSYFRTEGLEDGQISAVLDSVQHTIPNAGVTAGMLASASLNAEKLTTILLDHAPMPTSLQKEGLEWPYRMAVKIAAETLCQIGPRFADWERAKWQRSFAAFDQLLENQDQLLENQDQILQAVGSGEQAEDERFAQTYRAHIVRRLATIDASTFRVASSLALDLTTVFVRPDVLASIALDIDEDFPSLEQMASVEAAREKLLEQLQAQSSSERVSAEQFVTEHPRCAIVGLPGSGKTTLLQYLLLSVARGDLSFGMPIRRIPVLVRVHQLNQQQFPSVEELLHLESRVFVGVRPGFLHRQCEAGNVVLLIDGMDEIVDERRDALFQWIRDCVEVYPEARYMVSSRPAGYQAEFFRHLGFRECTLCEFSDNQIRDYVFRWTKAVAMTEGASPEEAEEMSAYSAATLVERAERNPYVRRLATNPLLLSTLCLVQRYEGGELPNRRTVLYERCVEGLLFHWDNKRGLPAEILGTLPVEHRLLLLRRVALKMHTQGVAEIEEEHIAEVFCTTLDEVGDAADAGDILANIRDRSGLLVERRPGIYGFSHLTFQEYLAALAIREADDTQFDTMFLFAQRHNPQWKEVIALFAGIAAREAVSRFIQEIVDTGDEAAIVLSGECLATAQAPPHALQKVVIQALLSLPFHKANEVSQILAVLDVNIVRAIAISALHTVEQGHAVRFLHTHQTGEVLVALQAAATDLVRAGRYMGVHELIDAVMASEMSSARDVLRRLMEACTEDAKASIGEIYKAGAAQYRQWMDEPRAPPAAPITAEQLAPAVKTVG
ncbi:MAG: NACHT domain-containing protein, partial [Candidatus Tectomicrobia bacterium]